MAAQNASSATRTPIVRSPADALRLVVAASLLLLLLIVERLFGSAITGFVHDLVRGLDALPEGFVAALVAVTRVASLLLIAAGLVAAALAGRWRLVGTVTAAAAAGAGLLWIVERWIETSRPAVATASAVAGTLTSRQFPTNIGVAAVAAVVTAAGPWVSRRYRRVGWLMVFALAAARFLVAPISAVSAAALLAGWAGGAIAVLALGAPSQRPTGEAITAGLRSVGLDVATLEPASVDARGSTPYFGATTAGQRVFVKVLGRDERDADLLFRLYRSVVPRQRGDERPFSSLRRAVEHEALVALAATELGVRTPRVAAFASADPGGFVLAYEAVDGRSLDGVDAGEVTDEVLRGVWGQIGLLREHRVAHRDLRLANLFLDRGGDVWAIDFGFSELAASDLLLASDLAELVCSLSLKVGPDRAVASGLAAVGRDALATALPRLRPGLLSGATRTGLKEAPGLLDQVRRAVAGSGATEPAPDRGQRSRRSRAHPS